MTSTAGATNQSTLLPLGKFPRIIPNTFSFLQDTTKKSYFLWHMFLLCINVSISFFFCYSTNNNDDNRIGRQVYRLTDSYNYEK